MIPHAIVSDENIRYNCKAGWTAQSPPHAVLTYAKLVLTPPSAGLSFPGPKRPSQEQTNNYRFCRVMGHKVGCCLQFDCRVHALQRSSPSCRGEPFQRHQRRILYVRFSKPILAAAPVSGPNRVQFKRPCFLKFVGSSSHSPAHFFGEDLSVTCYPEGNGSTASSCRISANDCGPRIAFSFTPAGPCALT